MLPAPTAGRLLLEARFPPSSTAMKNLGTHLGTPPLRKPALARKGGQSAPGQPRTLAGFIWLSCRFMQTANEVGAQGEPEHQLVQHIHFTDKQTEANQLSSGSRFPGQRTISAQLPSTAFHVFLSWRRAGSFRDFSSRSAW